MSSVFMIVIVLLVVPSGSQDVSDSDHCDANGQCVKRVSFDDGLPAHDFSWNEDSLEVIRIVRSGLLKDSDLRRCKATGWCVIQISMHGGRSSFNVYWHEDLDFDSFVPIIDRQPGIPPETLLQCLATEPDSYCRCLIDLPASLCQRQPDPSFFNK